MKTSTTMANHDPRMNRINPKYHMLLGIVGTWSTSCDFCNCLLFALCVLDSVLHLSCVLLKCVLLFCACACFGLSALKTLYRVKQQIGNLFKSVIPSHLFLSAWLA
jgi:hypothetical protein